MKYLSRDVKKFEEIDNHYVLESDFTAQEIKTICDFFEMTPIVRRITMEPQGYDFKIFLNEHITGIVSIGLSKDPNTIPELDELIPDVLEIAIAKGYKRLYWNSIPILVTKGHLQDIQEELEEQPDDENEKTQKQKPKTHRRYFNNMWLRQEVENVSFTWTYLPT